MPPPIANLAPVHPIVLLNVIIGPVGSPVAVAAFAPAGWVTTGSFANSTLKPVRVRVRVSFSLMPPKSRSASAARLRPCWRGRGRPVAPLDRSRWRGPPIPRRVAHRACVEYYVAVGGEPAGSGTCMASLMMRVQPACIFLKAERVQLLDKRIGHVFPLLCLASAFVLSGGCPTRARPGLRRQGRGSRRRW